MVALASRYVKGRFLCAFALGLFLWFFTDTIGDASLLGVSEGFSGGFTQVGLWVLFIVGLASVMSLDRELFAETPTAAGGSLMVPLLVAVAVGVHGFGEGASVGATAATTASTSLLDAFGGFSAGASFVLHKALEPMMVGAVYWTYSGGRGGGARGRLQDILMLTAAFTLPGIVGGASVYYLIQTFPNLDLTYVFALALGTSVYAMLRLVRPLYVGGGSRGVSLKVAAAVILGFACLYTAGLLHA